MWRRPLLNCYYHATLPYRSWQNARLGRENRAPVMVLFYHRVADRPLNGWTCGIATFRRQVHWLHSHFDMVSLEEAQRRIREGNPRPCVAITFDDGYAENCEFALPWLVREGIPCAYFVATRFVVEQTPFPHDVARGHSLRPNTMNELRGLAARGIEIGAHTRNHANLGQVTDPAELHDEVVAARDDLQAALGRPIRYFAFPYGQPENLSPAAFCLARKAAYAGVCSAYGGYNFPGDDPFHLQRFHGDPDLLRVKNWLTVDPRKLGVPRIDAPCVDTEPAATANAPAEAGVA